MDISQFRTDFPEFGDAAVYPDSRVNLFLTAATNFVDPCKWDNLTNLGIELWTAHNLVIAQRNTQNAAVGGIPGDAANVQSKKVGDVSVSYDNNVAAEQDAGQYNLTTYGKQYINYARMVGAGAVQL